MDLRQKTNAISLLVLVVCIVVAVFIYIFSGVILIAIIFAPPVIHWILKKREKSGDKPAK